jgi:NAD(P)-dependent dehydrogenase (short-subunit alcohol dehydrogenase family)
MEDTRTAVVTGAASGIGRALATVLTGRGYRVTLTDIDADGLEVVRAELDGSAAVVADVGDPAAAQRLAEAAGACDVVCLNAGVLRASDGAPWEASSEEWRRVFDVNVGGVVNGLRSFVPLLLDRPDPSTLLITASLAGLTTWPMGGAYGASKHAVVAIAEQAALELDGSQISVSVLCPALVRTGMSPEGEDPLVVAETALAAAEAGQFTIVSDEWQEAIRERSETLISGWRPRLPKMS